MYRIHVCFVTSIHQFKFTNAQYGYTCRSFYYFNIKMKTTIVDDYDDDNDDDDENKGNGSGDIKLYTDKALRRR